MSAYSYATDFFPHDHLPPQQIQQPLIHPQSTVQHHVPAPIATHHPLPLHSLDLNGGDVNSRQPQNELIFHQNATAIGNASTYYATSLSNGNVGAYSHPAAPTHSHLMDQSLVPAFHFYQPTAPGQWPGVADGPQFDMNYVNATPFDYSDSSVCGIKSWQADAFATTNSTAQLVNSAAQQLLNVDTNDILLSTSSTALTPQPPTSSISTSNAMVAAASMLTTSTSVCNGALSQNHNLTLKSKIKKTGNTLKHVVNGALVHRSVISNVSSVQRNGNLLGRPAGTNAPPKLFACNQCGRQYCRKSTLKAHMKQHLGADRQFECPTCGKTFTQAANLTAHRRVHTGEKPFACSICLRPFSQSSSLVTHRRTHTGERPYPCGHCTKSFTDSSTLTKHLRTHSGKFEQCFLNVLFLGQKPYSCHLCLMRFSQSGNLHRHMKTHRSFAITNDDSSNLEIEDEI
ncbi:hypothetical protein M3Y96_00953800 [Aphelenchoides besseyi]|nr:hypothetical protein M3Y96_00953800 [Aphelenchoides besseyi]